MQSTLSLVPNRRAATATFIAAIGLLGCSVRDVTSTTETGGTQASGGNADPRSLQDGEDGGEIQGSSGIHGTAGRSDAASQEAGSRPDASLVLVQGAGGTQAAGGAPGSGGAHAASAGAGPGGGLGGLGRGGSAGLAGTGGRSGRAGGGGSSGAAGDASADACSSSSSLTYDQTILCDNPVAYLAMNRLSGTEPDLTGNNHTGTYRGGAAAAATLPNHDQAADFDGSSQYVTVPSSPAFSIPTTGDLTWEAWIRPDVLQFPNDSGGYVDWMGKCAEYSPTCEWEARMYNTTNSQDRCNRFSAYVFNPSAGLGSGADWQPTCGLIEAGGWYHVVGEYTLKSQPSNCTDAAAYPGSIDIWVNGVPWNHASHGQTGCMSQYEVIPKANHSPLNIGTMAQDAWFQGAIGKVAMYDYLLTQAQVAAHYKRMTGKEPTGSCANTCSF